ncbi:RNA transcription, translation and transport factor protein-like [Uloborus diversus]|uniref:RNA transcription, translation and transport factor protein-like n=1 Tax=Uloborus diversus TaxID=327109 RepID=UPI00240A3EE9|nr:RNA transcription, translation and transport factor protein-like [Uloborus diversus]
MAYRRKLEALDYNKIEDFNVFDDEQFRTLVVWLEDQYIRHYPIENRAPLRKTTDPTWEEAFNSYLKANACPFTDREEIADWLLGLAVRLEYEDNIDKYKTITAESVNEQSSTTPQVKASNPLDNLDFESDEFKGYVKSLAQLLGVSPHPNHLETLSAVCTIIQKHFSEEALKNKQGKSKDAKPSPIMELPLGFETGDPVLEKAAKILRLCFIHDLRDLQTKINEIIVAVQNITANPKTDTRLGKVGR